MYSFHAAAGPAHTPFRGNEIHGPDGKLAQQGEQNLCVPIFSSGTMYMVIVCACNAESCVLCTSISLASIHPNHREKSPLAHCMVKIEKWLTRHCVFLYGLKGICLSVLNRGKEVHFTALLLMSAMYMPHLWPYSIC